VVVDNSREVFKEKNNREKILKEKNRCFFVFLKEKTCHPLKKSQRVVKRIRVFLFGI
jgi:hypothetical protein